MLCILSTFCLQLVGSGCIRASLSPFGEQSWLRAQRSGRISRSQTLPFPFLHFLWRRMTNSSKDISVGGSVSKDHCLEYIGYLKSDGDLLLTFLCLQESGSALQGEAPRSHSHGRCSMTFEQYLRLSMRKYPGLHSFSGRKPSPHTAQAMQLKPHSCDATLPETLWVSPLLGEEKMTQRSERAFLVKHS